MNLTPNNTDIIYGDINITTVFNLIGITSIPSNNNFNAKYEPLSNGSSRIIYERNKDNVFTIMLDRSSAKSADVNILKQLKNDVIEAKLTIYNKFTGSVEFECEKAIINSFKEFPAGISEGHGNDIELTFNIVHGE